MMYDFRIKTRLGSPALVIAIVFVVSVCSAPLEARPFLQIKTAIEELPPNIVDLVQQADRLLGSKRYDEAIAQYKYALVRAGRPVFVIFLNLGSAYFQKQDYPSAAGAFKMARQIRPNDWTAHYNLAEALYASGDYSDSEASYRKVIGLNVEGIFAIQAHHFLGLTLYKQGRIDEAIAAYKTALELSKGIYAEAHNNLGTALMEQKNYQAAEREFRLTIAQDRTFTVAYFNLAVALENQERYKEAIQEYERFLKLDPGYGDASGLRAHIEKLKKQK